jgi:hypothetical protein
MGGLLGIDGAAVCSADGRTWAHPITVWRGQTFQAESASLSGAALAINCATCSNAHRVGWINSTSGVTFQNVRSAAGGSQSVVVYYTNGDGTDLLNRSFNISVNGGAAQHFAFPATGDWDKPTGSTISLTGFLAGGNNTIRFVADGTHAAPDLDWIEIMPGSGWTIEAETGSIQGTAKASGCGTCSASSRVTNFGLNTSLTIGKIKASTAGTHTVVVYYTSGYSTAASIYVSVNGNAKVLLSGAFPPTGDWGNVRSVALTLSGFLASSTNSITFSTDATFTAPDFDFIEVN